VAIINDSSDMPNHLRSTWWLLLVWLYSTIKLWRLRDILGQPSWPEECERHEPEATQYERLRAERASRHPRGRNGRFIKAKP
jgi:hypothetical protein